MTYKLRILSFLTVMSYFSSAIFAGYIIKPRTETPIILAEPFEISIPYTTLKGTPDFISSTKEFNSYSSFVITNEDSSVDKQHNSLPKFPLATGDVITGFEIIDTNNQTGWYNQWNDLATLYKTLSYGQYIIGTLSKSGQNTYLSFKVSGILGDLINTTLSSTEKVSVFVENYTGKNFPALTGSFIIAKNPSDILKNSQLRYFTGFNTISALKINGQSADLTLINKLNDIYTRLSAGSYIKGTYKPLGSQTYLYFEVINTTLSEIGSLIPGMKVTSTYTQEGDYNLPYLANGMFKIGQMEFLSGASPLGSGSVGHQKLINIMNNMYYNGSTGPEMYITILGFDENGQYIKDVSKVAPKYYKVYFFDQNQTLQVSMDYPTNGTNLADAPKSNNFTISYLADKPVTLTYPFMLNVKWTMRKNLPTTKLDPNNFNGTNIGSSNMALSNFALYLNMNNVKASVQAYNYSVEQDYPATTLQYDPNSVVYQFVDKNISNCAMTAHMKTDGNDNFAVLKYYENSNGHWISKLVPNILHWNSSNPADNGGNKKPDNITDKFLTNNPNLQAAFDLGAQLNYVNLLNLSLTNPSNNPSAYVVGNIYVKYINTIFENAYKASGYYSQSLPLSSGIICLKRQSSLCGGHSRCSHSVWEAEMATIENSHIQPL